MTDFQNHFFNDFLFFCEFTIKNFKFYVKNDFKLVLFIFSLFFLSIFGIYNIGVQISRNQLKIITSDNSEPEDPFLSGQIFNEMAEYLTPDIISVIFISLIFLILFLLFFQLSFEKSLLIYNSKLNNPTNYSIIPNLNIKEQASLFISSISSFLIIILTFSIILLFLKEIFVYFTILNGPNLLVSLFSVFFIIIIPFLITGLLLFPTQLQPIIIMNEKIGFNSSLLKSFKIFKSWKYKLLFSLSMGLFSFIGLMVNGFLIIIIVVFLSLSTIINTSALNVYLLVISLLTSLFFIISYEFGSILIGTFYGQIYFTLDNEKVT